MHDVFVGIGSNIDPLPHLHEAVDALRDRYGSLRLSSVYRSPAYGFEGDPFLNMVAGFATDDSPAVVEAFLSSVEYSGGRERGPSRFAPRTLDIDLLLYAGLVHAALKLPRVDILRYAFVLAPLAEVASGLVHPVTGRAVGDIWRDRVGEHPELERLGALADLAA